MSFTSLENLEHRCMFSASLANGVLAVSGTAGNDVIVINEVLGYTPRLLRVTENGQPRSFALNQVSSIRVDAKGGADFVSLDARRVLFSQLRSVNIPATVSGGDGNDTIIGGNAHDELWGNRAPNPLKADRVGVLPVNGSLLPILIPIDDDAIYSGAGNDSMHGNEGSDKMYGGAGDDRIWGDAGRDNIYGEAGNDNLFGGGDSDNVYGGIGEDTLVSVGGGVDKLYGQGNSDLFWKDDNVRETTDADLGEIFVGNVNAVRSFANGASKELYGQKIADPDATAIIPTTIPGPFGVPIPTVTVRVPPYANFSNVPLFGANGPQVSDIAQGGAGDCFFLAPLAGQVQAGKGFKIRQRVVDLGDGTYGVSFRNASGANVYYRVDADLPATFAGSATPYYAQTANNTLWVPIIEKAYTHFRSGANSYQSIWNGSANHAFDALGMSREESNNIKAPSVSQTLLNIKAALAGGKVVTLATPGTAPPAGNPAVPSHVYTVVSVTTMPFATGAGYMEVPIQVIVRNPWGFDGPNGNRDATDGYLVFSASQAEYFIEALAATA